MAWFESEYERGRRHERDGGAGWGTLIGLGIAIAIVWFFLRLVLRLVMDGFYFVLMLVQKGHYLFFISAVLLIGYSIWGILTGKQSKIKVWALVGGFLACLIGYWGFIRGNVLEQLPGTYVRNDKKTRLSYSNDTLQIWSGKNHLVGTCQLRSHLFTTNIRARIDGFPDSEESKGAFSNSIDGMFGETIYQFTPTEDSLFIIDQNDHTIRYARVPVNVASKSH